MRFVNSSLLYLIFIGLLVLSFSCTNVLSPGNENSNLIPNPSFEYNGVPSLQFWTLEAAQDSLFRDAPPVGGEWSLQMIPKRNPGSAVARTYVTGQEGTGVYQLTADIKSMSSMPSIILGVWSQGELHKYVSALSQGAAGQWGCAVLSDTLSLTPSDTIAVELATFGDAAVSGQTRFDEVQLLRIATLKP